MEKELTFISFAEAVLSKIYKNNKHIKHEAKTDEDIENQKIVFLDSIEKETSFTGFLITAFRFYLYYVGKDITKHCMDILNKKSQDYSEVNNRYSVFDFCSKYALDMGITNEVNPDIAFVILLGVKISRLKELLLSGKDPNFESIEDSIIDLINYRILWEGKKLGLQ